MLISVLSLEKICFIKGKRIHVSRGTSETWPPVSFASWLNS